MGTVPVFTDGDGEYGSDKFRTYMFHVYLSLAYWDRQRTTTRRSQPPQLRTEIAPRGDAAAARAIGVVWPSQGASRDPAER